MCRARLVGVVGNDSCRPDGVCVLGARQMTAKVGTGRTVEQVVTEQVNTSTASLRTVSNLRRATIGSVLCNTENEANSSSSKVGSNLLVNWCNPSSRGWRTCF